MMLLRRDEGDARVVIPAPSVVVLPPHPRHIPAQPAPSALSGQTPPLPYDSR